MNRIVREHYPVSRLPDDLKTGFPAGAIVRVEVEVEEPHKTSINELRNKLQQLHESKKIAITTEDPADRIRKLRDEWDE